jgi:hypothetical protein
VTDKDNTLNKCGRIFARKVYGPVTVRRIRTKGDVKELPLYREGYEVEKAGVVETCNFSGSKGG